MPYGFEIEDGVLYRCITSASEVVIPDGVTEIGYDVFSGCIGLTSIVIPDSITKIGKYAFCGCKVFSSVTIPDSVTEIGEAAFDGCSGLTSLIIPDSVKTFDSNNVFSDCTSLTVICYANSEARRYCEKNNIPVKSPEPAE